MDILPETDTMDEVNRLEAEQCSSTLVQLVQLPTHSDTPGVSMVRNTGTVEQRKEQSSVVPPQYSWSNYPHTLILQVFLWLETLEL